MINSSTNPPSLHPFDLEGIDLKDDDAVTDLITRVCKTAGVQSAGIVNDKLVVTIKGYDELGGFKPGKELSKAEFVDEAITKIVAGRTGAQRVQTTIGRGAGGGGFI